jgi:hypothetical protein
MKLQVFLDLIRSKKRYGYAGQLPSCAFHRRILSSIGLPGQLARRIVCLPAYSLQG